MQGGTEDRSLGVARKLGGGGGDGHQGNVDFLDDGGVSLVYLHTKTHQVVDFKYIHISVVNFICRKL